MANPKTFLCPSCAKRYTWRPQLAGKKAKCTCGRLIEIPKAEVEPEKPADKESALYGVVPDEKPSASPTTQAARCPSCGSVLPAASTLCIHCGFDTVTGKKIATPAAHARSVAMEEHAKAEESENKSKIFMLVGLLILLVGGAALGFFAMKQKGGVGAPTRGMDASIEAMMSNEGATELREWIKAGGRHMVMGMTDQQALNHADEWYKLGAKKVFAFGEVVTASVVIELPDEPAKRKAFFDASPRWTKFGEPPQKDVGQKWIIFYMHI